MWGLTTFVPVFSALVWLAMLITMLVVWSTSANLHLRSMKPNQSIAYISNIGAEDLKPLFIAMSAVSVVTFDVAFILERWLRHRGILTRNTSFWQKLYSWISIVAAIAGAAGLILLTIFDTLRHNTLHNIFLGVFIIGYIVSAIFICWEYQRLGIHFREHSILRYSFWIKLMFILVEAALAVAFGVTSRMQDYNVAAVLEWVIAFVYFFYVLSFFIDFMPAFRAKGRHSGQTEMDVARMEMSTAGDGAGDERRFFRGGARASEFEGATANGNGNGYHANGMKPHKPVEPVAPSRNF